MSGLYFDVFAADDPNGTSLGELTDAYAKSFQGVHQALGSGQFTINRHSSQATWAVADNLIRVRRAEGGPFDFDDPRYIGAFWIESGTRALLSENEEGGEEQTWGGRSIEAGLRWAILYPDAFDARNDQYTDKTRIDGNWHIPNVSAGSVLAIFMRDLDDRSPDPLPYLDRDFGFTNDSTGTPWSDTATDWDIPVGTNGLDLLAKCVSGGLFYRVEPSFMWHAYEDEPGQDLHLTISLTKGDNIASSADQDINARETVGRVVVQGTKKNGRLVFKEVVSATVEAALPGRREGFVEYRATPTEAKLAQAGTRYINKAKRRHDGPLQLAYVEETGQEAFTDFAPGDVISVYTPGLSVLRVYAITLSEDDAGNVTPVVDFEQSPFDPSAGNNVEFDDKGNGHGANCGDCPPAPPFQPCTHDGEGNTDDAFAAIVQLHDASGTAGQLTFVQDADVAGSGWFPMPRVAPLALVESADPFVGITTSQAIRVRIEAKAVHSDAVVGPQSATLQVLVNGTVVGFDTQSTGTAGPHFWATSHYVNIPSIALAAGDVVSLGFSSTQDLFWTNTTNECYLRVGRGTHSFNSGALIWVGPDSSDTLVPIDCVPLEGQQHVEELTGDGATTTGQTNYPYAPGSLEVSVDGLVTPVTETDPTTGSFTFATAPGSGSVIIVRYQNAGTTSTGAGNPAPTASTPTITAGVVVQDEGSPLATAGTTFNFVGAGVVASGSGAVKTITISEPAEAAHEADATDAHDASAISVLDAGGHFAATDVEAALAELYATAAAIVGLPAGGAVADRLRWNGSAWVSSSLRWSPIGVNVPTLVTTDGQPVYVPWTTVDGQPILAEVP